MALSLEKRVENGSIILSPDGELDIESSPIMRQELMDLIKNGHNRIVVDMSGVSYMDSSGLGALVSAHRTLEGKGSLALIGTRPVVERVLRFTQIDKVLELYRNFEDFEAGQRDNLRAVSGISRSVIQKQKAIPRPVAPKSPEKGRRLS